MHVVRAVRLARIYCGCASIHLHLHIRVRALPFLFHRKARALGYLLQGHNKLNANSYQNYIIIETNACELSVRPQFSDAAAALWFL